MWKTSESEYIVTGNAFLPIEIDRVPSWWLIMSLHGINASIYECELALGCRRPTIRFSELFVR